MPEANQAIPRATDGVKRIRELLGNPMVHNLVRAGYLTRALMYWAIGLTAIELGLGRGSAVRDQGQVMILVRHSLLGALALSLFMVGILCYGLWELLRATVDPLAASGFRPGAVKRVEVLLQRSGYVVGGLYWLSLFSAGVQLLQHFPADNTPSAITGAITLVLALPGGRFLTMALGVVMAFLALPQLRDAMRASFRHDLDATNMSGWEYTSIVILGRLGTAARGVILAIVGGFMVSAGSASTPTLARGISGAFGAVNLFPLGHLLVGLLGFGFVGLGMYSFTSAWYLRWWKPYLRHGIGQRRLGESATRAGNASVVLVLLNEQDGGGRVSRRVRQIIRDRNLEVVMVDANTLQGDLEGWARDQASAGAARIVVAGGDGTIGSIARGLMHSSTVMGVVSAGTYNNFARALGLPADPADALDVALGDCTRWIGAGGATASSGGPGEVFREEVFFQELGVGLEGQVLLLGDLVRAHRFRAFLAGSGALLRCRQVPIRIASPGADDDLEEPALLVTVSNTGTVGRHMAIAPAAVIFDDVLDLAIYSGMGRRHVVRHFVLLSFGGTGSKDRPRRAVVSEVSIDSPEHLVVHCDGRQVGHLPVTVRSIPRALKVAVVGGSGTAN